MTETGRLVYERTYSRERPDGTREEWPDTVRRVVDGNIAFVDPRHIEPGERQRLAELMEQFKILPGGRHLWMSGVPTGNVINCWIAPVDSPSRHVEFMFARLMEGGGVGANYSARYLAAWPPIASPVITHIVCDPTHPDYADLEGAGLLSNEFSFEWAGAYSVEDSREGWAGALGALVTAAYDPTTRYEARVFDMSRVRRAGAKLRTFGGVASGPAPLARMLTNVGGILWEQWRGRLTGLDVMAIDHEIASCVVAGGNRRSARMSIMSWQDDEIFDFITCKADTSAHWTTNVSVEVDDEFFAALDRDDPGAKRVLEAVTDAMLSNGEPGLWNYSLNNRGEPTEVISSNPCGEVATGAAGNCNLGHVNLGAAVRPDGSVDWAGLREAHRLIARFLIRATYSHVGDDQARQVMARDRRIGVGHFGYQSFLTLRGFRYSSSWVNPGIRDDLGTMAAWVDEAIAEYAHELRIPVPVKSRVVAPTGTVAKLVGETEGIHPIFATHFLRRIRLSTLNPAEIVTAQEMRDQGYLVEPCQYAENTVVVEIPTRDVLLDRVAAIHGQEQAVKLVESVDEITLFDLLQVQQMYQQAWADMAVSFTANIDASAVDRRTLAAYLALLGRHLKGATIFPEVSRPQSPYERITVEEYEAAAARAVADGLDEDCAGGACPVR